MTGCTDFIRRHGRGFSRRNLSASRSQQGLLKRRYRGRPIRDAIVAKLPLTYSVPVGLKEFAGRRCDFNHVVESWNVLESIHTVG